MTVRAKYHLLSFVAFPVGGFALIMLGITAHALLGYMLLPYTLVVSVVGHSMRCPKCHARLVWQGYLGFPYLSKHCRSCGHDLGKEEPGKRQY